MLHQTRFDLRSFSRDKQARFTTLALPIVLLVAFVSIGGGDKTFVQDGHTITTAVFFVPGLIALAVISASFSNLLTDLVAQRDSGILKRRRATPVPAYALIGGRTLTATAISLATAALLLLAGGNIYDVAIPNHALPAVAITIILGSITFSALAYALAPSIHSSTAIQPVITLILLPLYAISGVLLPNSKNPDWLNHIASTLPLQHLAHALHHAFDPPPTDSESAPSTSPSSPHGHSPPSPSPPHASAGYPTPTSQPELRGSALRARGDRVTRRSLPRQPRACRHGNVRGGRRNRSATAPWT